MAPLQDHQAARGSATSRGTGKEADMKLLLLALLMAPMAASLALPASAQQMRYKYQTPAAPGVATPDKLETSIGTLNLSDGYPDATTVQKIYDNLDASRALQAYLLALPIVNHAGMREAIRKFGPDNQTNVIFENLTDSRSLQLTPNDNTIYSWIWLDTHKGPLVVQMPPKVLGMIDDFWYRWAADVGITGADKGKGGKYLVL